MEQEKCDLDGCICCNLCGIHGFGLRVGSYSSGNVCVLPDYSRNFAVWCYFLRILKDTGTGDCSHLLTDDHPAICDNRGCCAMACDSGSCDRSFGGGCQVLVQV